MKKDETDSATDWTILSNTSQIDNYGDTSSLVVKDTSSSLVVKKPVSTNQSDIFEDSFRDATVDLFLPGKTSQRKTDEDVTF